MKVINEFGQHNPVVLVNH